MARVVLLMLLVAYGSCMEMRETVERMVVVRTSGSDLQPAATGYIYKKESDGPASVIKMGESEVMERLSKLYEQPKTFTAPIPVAAGPFYAKEDDDKAAYSSESKVIPVVENQDDNDEKIDGIADEDYGKLFGEYASDFGDYKSDFDDYLKSLGYFEDGVYHENKDFEPKKHNENDGKGHEGFGKKHNYDDGNGNYHTEKYESYKISNSGRYKKPYGEADHSGKPYAYGHGYKSDHHGYKPGFNKEGDHHGFRNHFDEDEHKKDHDFYDGEENKDGFKKFSHGYGSNDGGAGGYGHEADDGHRDDRVGNSDHQDESGDEHRDGTSKGEPSQHYHRDFSTKDGESDGKSYGYNIKH